MPTGTKRVCLNCFVHITKRICDLEECGRGAKKGGVISDANASSSSATKKKENVGCSWNATEIDLVKKSLRYV